MVALVVMGYSILAFFEFRPLLKQKLWRDFWMDAILGVLSFTIAILLCLDVKIPSPEKPIRELITSVFGK
jgi:hypothetical protein